MNWLRLMIEAVVVGIVLVIFGYAGSYLAELFLPDVSIPESCKDWNKHYAMEWSLLFTGILAHLFFEVAGINRWYCKNGHACRFI